MNRVSAGFLVLVVVGFSLLISSFSTVAHAGKMTDPGTYFGTIHKQEGSEVDLLRTLLIAINQECTKVGKKCDPGVRLFELISGDFNMASRPVHIVYFDENDQVQTNLVLHKERVTPFLYGQRVVWMVVFAENRLNLHAEITTLWRQKKGSVADLEGVFVSEGRQTTEAREAQIETGRLVFDRLSGISAEDDLYYATEQFFLEPLGVYSTSVSPSEKSTEEGTGSVDARANFSNSLARSIDLGLALGATLRTEPGDELVLDGVNVGDANLSLYLMLDIYIIKPALLSPMVETMWGRYRPSIGIAIGTNLQFWEAEEINVGVSVGHLFGRHGLVFGVNIIDSQTVPGEANEGGGSDDHLIRPFIAGLFKF